MVLVQDVMTCCTAHGVTTTIKYRDMAADDCEVPSEILLSSKIYNRLVVPGPYCATPLSLMSFKSSKTLNYQPLSLKYLLCFRKVEIARRHLIVKTLVRLKNGFF